MPDRLIQVTERSCSEISTELWQEVSNSPELWNLVEAGVVRVEQRSGGKFALCANCFVGRAQIAPEVTLDVCEKVPGSIDAMLRVAAGSDFRIERIRGATSASDRLLSLVLAEFVASVRRYASGGREFEYLRVADRGSLIGGRLDMPRTLSLRARGLRHIAAFDRNVASFATPANCILFLAIREAERLSRQQSFPTSINAQARSMALLFSDCAAASRRIGARLDAVRLAENLASTAATSQLRDSMELAALVLSHKAIDVSIPTAQGAPRAWFVNLESLFERAVRAALRRACGSSWLVRSGREAPRPIFTDRVGDFSANPDLVIQRRTLPPAAIGDVKYKVWDGKPSASDVYQLLCHANAFGTSRAFLVYPSDRFSSALVGTTQDKIELWTAQVNVADIERDVACIALQFMHQPIAEAALAKTEEPATGSLLRSN
jgi:5-methylcytosine-specific restriction endonuclease McrBC regulatory subunit McrC